MSDTTLGPTGGHGGHEFNDYTVPAGASVREVHVFAGFYVDAVQLAYVDAGGALVLLPKIGGHGFPSPTHHVVTLEPGEVLVGISGRSGGYVDSIRIHTNRRVSDSFGGFTGDHEYRFEAPDNSEIAGFFGRADWYIDALGVVVRERAAAEIVEVPVVAAPVAIAEVARVDAPPVAPVAPAAKPAKAKASAKTPPAAVPAEAPVVADAKPAKAKAPAKTPPTEAPVVADVKPVKVEASVKTPPAAAPAEAPVAAAAKPAKAKASAKTVAAPVVETSKASDAPAVSAPTRSEPVVDLAASTPRVDELLKVEGIGPKIEALLVENGIPDLQTLAVTPVERLREILHAAGARYRISDPTTWPQQAALGASGDWAGMEALQVTLRGGRKKE
jgi:predicted flap endonuclease-1-like 5' DNA nuclease